jgi:hypothetical protein
LWKNSSERRIVGHQKREIDSTGLALTPIDGESVWVFDVPFWEIVLKECNCLKRYSHIESSETCGVYGATEQ